MNSNVRITFCSHSQLSLTSLWILYFSSSVKHELFEKLHEFLFVSALREERIDVEIHIFSLPVLNQHLERRKKTCCLVLRGQINCPLLPHPLHFLTLHHLRFILPCAFIYSFSRCMCVCGKSGCIESLTPRSMKVRRAIFTKSIDELSKEDSYRHIKYTAAQSGHVTLEYYLIMLKPNLIRRHLLIKHQGFGGVRFHSSDSEVC